MSVHGRILWTELNTHHVEKAKSFYGAAFGWTFQANPMPEGGTYWTATAQGAATPVAGIFDMSGPQFEGMPEQWLTYFGVDDIDASLAALPGLGGQVVRPAWDVPAVGRIAIVCGATGAGEGWMTPLPRGG